MDCRERPADDQEQTDWPMNSMKNELIYAKSNSGVLCLCLCVELTSTDHTVSLGPMYLASGWSGPSLLAGHWWVDEHRIQCVSVD